MEQIDADIEDWKNFLSFIDECTDDYGIMYPGIHGCNAFDPCASIWCNSNDLLCSVCIYRSFRFKDGLFRPFQQHYADDRADDRSCERTRQDKPDPPFKRRDGQASG